MPGKMFPDDLAEKYKGTDKKYRPSNGTEGMIFREKWCVGCKIYRGESDCEILAATFWLAVDDPQYPKEWTYDEDGQPCCTAYVPPTKEE